MRTPSHQLLQLLRTNLSERPIKHLPRSQCLHAQPFGTLCSRLAPATNKSSTFKKPTNPKLQTHDRGPRSNEDTQTDFQTLDIYSNTTPPATTIDACLDDGFHINNGEKVTGGSGVMLLGGEAFKWKPWKAISESATPYTLLAKTGALDLSGTKMFGLLALLHPLPDLLILGTGASTRPVTKQTRELLASLGVKVDIMDTNNAAASFNLLSTERGTEGVAAAMLPAGWK